MIAKLCERHEQVVAVNLAGLGDLYFVQLQNALTRDVDIYVPYVSALHTLSMGAAGLLGAEARDLIVLVGPSHHVQFPGCAILTRGVLETPWDPLPIAEDAADAWRRALDWFSSHLA